MTEEEKKQELTKEFADHVSNPIGKLQFLFIVAIFASVFVFIWGNSSYGWKTLLTGLVGTVSLGIINFIWVKIATKIANKEFDKINAEIESKKSSSRFEQRLSEMQKKKEASK